MNGWNVVVDVAFVEKREKRRRKMSTIKMKHDSITHLLYHTEIAAFFIDYSHHVIALIQIIYKTSFIFLIIRGKRRTYDKRKISSNSFNRRNKLFCSSFLFLLSLEVRRHIQIKTKHTHTKLIRMKRFMSELIKSNLSNNNDPFSSSSFFIIKINLSSLI